MSSADMDPADMNPADMNPADMDPADMNPADMNPADMDPADMDLPGMGPTGFKHGCACLQAVPAAPGRHADAAPDRPERLRHHRIQAWRRGRPSTLGAMP